MPERAEPSGGEMTHPNAREGWYGCPLPRHEGLWFPTWDEYHAHLANEHGLDADD